MVREGGGPFTTPGFGSFIGSTCPLSFAEYLSLAFYLQIPCHHWVVLQHVDIMHLFLIEQDVKKTKIVERNRRGNI
jgi:hypothetical protein